MNLQKSKIIYAVVGTVVAVGLILGGYFYYTKVYKKAAEPVKKEEVKETACGALVADGGKSEGTAPFAPILRANLNGSVDDKSPICIWSVNGNELQKSYPVGKSCVFGDRSFTTPGNYEVSYKLEEKNCSASSKIVVK